VTGDRNNSVDATVSGVVLWQSGAEGLRRERRGANEMIRTTAAADQAHVAGRARPCVLGTWYGQPASGPVFMTAIARWPSERPT
jgi:hypothetical protein